MATTAGTSARPHSLSPRGIAIAGWTSFVIAGAIFFVLAWNVAAHAPLVDLDARVSAWLHQRATPWLTNLMLVVTHAHSLTGVAVASMVFAWLLARLRAWYWMLSLALAVAGGSLLNVMLKFAYERARPSFDDPFVNLTTFSFPSGHTAAATLFYGVLAAFLVSRTADRHARVAIVLAAALLVVLVALSRVYLGAHYLSDVVAAMCSSTAWLAVCLSGVHALVRRRMSRP